MKGSNTNLQALGKTSLPPSGLRPLPVTSHSAPDLEDLDAFPRGFSRESFVVVPLDGLFRGPAVRPRTTDATVDFRVHMLLRIHQNCSTPPNHI